MQRPNTSHTRGGRRLAASALAATAAAVCALAGGARAAEDLKTIAVVGPTADDLVSLLGNYNGTPSRPATILAGIRNAVSPGPFEIEVGASSADLRLRARASVE
jgi:Ni,Fe-hydrogenase III small subunit